MRTTSCWSQDFMIISDSRVSSSIRRLLGDIVCPALLNSRSGSSDIASTTNMSSAIDDNSGHVVRLLIQ
jgi:hypothetical protein